MTRQRRGALLTMLGLSVVLSASCGERLADSDAAESHIRCAVIVAYIDTPEGDRVQLLNSETGVRHDLWCTCTTEEEWASWRIDEAFTEWVNEMAYAACLDFVEREGYEPAHSDCLERHEQGPWPFGFPEDIGDDLTACDAGELPVGCGAE